MARRLGIETVIPWPVTVAATIQTRGQYNYTRLHINYSMMMNLSLIWSITVWTRSWTGSRRQTCSGQVAAQAAAGLSHELHTVVLGRTAYCFHRESGSARAGPQSACASTGSRR